MGGNLTTLGIKNASLSEAGNGFGIFVGIALTVRYGSGAFFYLLKFNFIKNPKEK
jgi:hypothetical protein